MWANLLRKYRENFLECTNKFLLPEGINDNGGKNVLINSTEFLISRLRHSQSYSFSLFSYQGNVSRAGTKCPIALEGPEITARRGSSKRLGVRKPWDSPELEDREELSEMTKRSQDGPYRFLPTTPYLPFRQVLQARSQWGNICRLYRVKWPFAIIFVV